jgi:hypothetical protein
MHGTDPIVNTARALIDALNQRDFSIWENAASPELVADYPNAHDLNKDAARGYNLGFYNACDKPRFDVLNTFVNGASVAFQASVTATFDNPLVTPEGTIPPTGRTGTIPFILICEVKDDKIVTEQIVWDELEFFKLWGIIPQV